MHRPVRVSARLSPWLAPWLLCGAVLPALAAEPGVTRAAGAHGPAATQAVSAPAAASASDADTVDPIERLRQRLAERLAGGPAPRGTASGDLRVVARTGSVKPVSAPLSAQAHKVTARRADKPVGHEVERTDKPVSWSYAGAGGPQVWAELKPEFALCGKGERQSPVDIRGGLAVDLDPVRFDYRASPFGVLDNGHTVQVNVAPGNSIDVGGRHYELQQFHFHRPAEEHIDGRSFEMSMHLVHKDEQGHLAVVAVLFEKGEQQTEVQKVWNNLPLERNRESTARGPIDLPKLLPVDRRYATYMGSLTTPPCSEGVQWIVMRQPVTLTAEQLGIFARIYPMNARPLQALAGRRIIQSR